MQKQKRFAGIGHCHQCLSTKKEGKKRRVKESSQDFIEALPCWLCFASSSLLQGYYLSFFIDVL